MKTLPNEIPRFALYGENTPIDNAEFVHIELIETRSRLHDWHIGPHTHCGLFQVLFLMAGHVSAQVENMLWECDGPTVITIHPSVVHAFDFSQEAQGYVLTMDQNVVLSVDLFAPLFLRPQALRLHENAIVRDRLGALLHQLIQEAAGPRYGQALMVEWLARSVLLLLVRLETERRMADQSGHVEFELFSRFRALVEEHFREQWLVGRYAEELRLTPVRLNRLCVKLAGKSAFEMAQDRLMLEACRKLTYVPTPIATIGYELGFQDPAYFSRLFRKRVGLTPKAYREQSRNGAAQPASMVE
ncbi:helix-turn-helix domain-containing protein [Pseudoduganella umbonata]|uniref:AraC family transcriptional activator of pobA n=1 Tax=Pseudoduganella umbonata TaxID=864828 RepID=A0A4P8HKI9_9BURK|nr:helix-turn-helix domain-containing protein [Pseudoduganella umbonata]MBB3219299.1 AraC family transcriptional activator of pobA [Pseudoduganella umbonata]QCP09406.1 helix-turn-helix domain-containing protein [Pseudoduganella umbonata]